MAASKAWLFVSLCCQSVAGLTTLLGQATEFLPVDRRVLPGIKVTHGPKHRTHLVTSAVSLLGDTDGLPSVFNFSVPNKTERKLHQGPKFTATIDTVKAAVDNANQQRERVQTLVRNAADSSGDEVVLWPLPGKVCAVFILFVILEHVIDYMPCSVFKPAIGDVDDIDSSAMEPPPVFSPYTNPKQTLYGRLSVLTLNVYVNHVRQVAQLQIRKIRYLNPDVVCLQEVFDLDVLEAYRRAFPDYLLVAFGRAHNFSALLALTALMLALSTLFSGVILIFEKLLHGRWRVVWLFACPTVMIMYSRLIRHHWTIAFLTGNRTGLAMLVRRDAVDVDIKAIRCQKFSRVGHAADLLNLLRPRGFLSVTGQLRLNGCPEPVRVRLVNTHLNQPLDQALGDGRHRQVKEILSSCLQDDELLVLSGDLNATPPGTNKGTECKTYEYLAEHLTDSWAASNPSDPSRDGLTWDMKENPLAASPVTKAFYGSFLLRWRCDYIFWRRSMTSKISEEIAEADKGRVSVDLQSCNLVFTGPRAVSDHYGVHAVFEVSGRTRTFTA